MDIRRVEQADVAGLAAELLGLQHRAYAIEAALIGDDRIPTLHESEADLVAAGLTWLVAIDGRVVGGIGFTEQNATEQNATEQNATEQNATVDIDRLIVEPAQFRRGIGRRLVEAALGPKTPGSRASVSTGRENAPARKLYASLGFRHEGDREVVPGLWVSDYARP